MTVARLQPPWGLPKVAGAGTISYGRSERPSRRTTTIEAQKLAVEAARLADLKKGRDIRVLEVGDQIRVADYFVVVTATSKPHAKAIYNEIHVGLKSRGERHRPAEGTDLGWWVLLDYGDVVVHLLQGDARTYYDLDNLYGECPEVDWQGAAGSEKAAETA